MQKNTAFIAMLLVALVHTMLNMTTAQAMKIKSSGSARNKLLIDCIHSDIVSYPNVHW
jgi:hypothetical protein